MNKHKYMIEEIINSKIDLAVLSFFIVAPERCFSVIELSKRLNISSAKLASVLSGFIKQGIVVSFSKKNKRYYMFNSRYKLMPEVKSFLHKNGQKYQDELFLAVRRLGDIKAAYLSGVFVGLPNLPVDILLVGKVNLKKLDEFLKNAEKMMGQEINYSIMTVDEFLLRRDTFDRFIKDIFDYRRLVVVDELSGGRKKK